MKKSIWVLMFALSGMSYSFADATTDAYSTGINESEAAMKTRWIQTFAGKDAKEISKKNFIAQFTAQYADLFKQHKNVTQSQFVAYEQAKLEQQIAVHREMSMKQADVRFGILSNKAAFLSLKQFQDTGIKTFNNFDKNGNGYVDQQDVEANAQIDTAHAGTAFRSVISMPMPTTVNEFIAEYGQGKQYVSLAAYLTLREKQFNQMDSDHNRQVTEQEYVAEFKQRYDANIEQSKAAQAQFAQQRFAAMAGQQQTINAKDVEKFAQQLFKHWDKQGSGVMKLY